jgi:hypothetical protein
MLLHPSSHIEPRVLVGVFEVFPVLCHWVLCSATNQQHS